MVRVKICGITSFDDALLCVKEGIDGLGFVFYPGSKRYILPEEAEKIVKELPPFICKVGVFVNEEGERVLDIAHWVGLDAIQLHGEETPDVCKRLAQYFTVIKAFSIAGPEDPERVFEYKGVTPLFDTQTPEYGGSGKTFIWKYLIPYREKVKYFILSGGLTVENVEHAIKAVNPYAVDVSSGVERTPGKKDPDKVREFIRLVKHISSIE